LTEAAALADPDNHIVMADNPDWTTCEVTVQIPDDSAAAPFRSNAIKL
jgi:hypothetical protein